MESYIKAFYLISDDLDTWVREKGGKYTDQQLSNLKSLQGQVASHVMQITSPQKQVKSRMRTKKKFALKVE